MTSLNLDDKVTMSEFLEQVNYALSLTFKEKWRHKYSENFINIFQGKILDSLKAQRPLKLSNLVSLYTKKHKYDITLVQEFLDNIDISLYYPLVYRDRKKPTDS
jgi:hypothetical protein